MPTDSSTKHYRALRITQARFSQIVLFLAMVSFAFALLRFSTLAGVFELLKFPMLMSAVASLFYWRPVIRLNFGSFVSWLFVALVTFSTIYNSANSPAIIYSIGVFIAIAVYFQAISNLVKPERLLYPVLRWFAMAVVLTSVFFLPLPGSFIQGRFAAGFINTNVASGFIAIAIVVLSYSVVFVRANAFNIIVLAVAVFLLLLTKGRGALIATAVPVFIMLVSNWSVNATRVNLIRFTALAAVFWLSVQLSISDTTNATQLGLMSFRSFELGAREVIMERHFSAFWHSPFFGVGAVIDLAAPYARTSGESSYSDLLALSGGIGFALILVLVVRALWTHWHYCQTRLGFFVLLTTLLLAGTEGYFVSIASAVSMILWALLAVSPKRSKAT